MSTVTDSRLISISKTLSWLLRHSGVKEGLTLSSDGFISVNDLLQHRSLIRLRCTTADVENVVTTSAKQRLSLRDNQGILEVCANQGHSISVDNLKLASVTLNCFPYIIHGTFFKFWDIIKLEGLNRMKRNHIHFSTGPPCDKNIISGIRYDTEILIYVDINKAINSGIKFFKSVNEVILSPGDENGTIDKFYFLKVVDARDGGSIEF